MKCDKCNGSGRIANPKYYSMANCYAYEQGIDSMKKCNTCKGMGYIGIDLNEMKQIMIVIYNTATISPSLKRELGYMLKQFDCG